MRECSFGVTARVSLWFSVARCFAADSSCVIHSRNRFCILADLCNSQPQFVFRFCDFLDMNLQDFVWKFFCRRTFFNPGKRHISASPEMRQNAEVSMAAESSHPCGANWHNQNLKAEPGCCRAYMNLNHKENPKRNTRREFSCLRVAQVTCVTGGSDDVTQLAPIDWY